jgi:hypothetical protein
LADCINAADNIAARIGHVSFADVGKCPGIAQHIDGLFTLGQVLRADQNGSCTAVPGNHDPLMLALNSVHELRRVVAD